MTRMTINGEGVHYKLDPETPLLWALRDASNLTGTKYGCDSRDCGACTVIIDGRAVQSCTVSITSLEGASVTTIEGLSANGTHPVQQAWLAEQATMCGYCEPGFIMLDHFAVGIAGKLGKLRVEVAKSVCLDLRRRAALQGRGNEIARIIERQANQLVEFRV